MDTIPKLLHHLLVALGVCNIFLLFAAMGGNDSSAHFHVSIHPLFAALLLAGQTAYVWRIIHTNQASGSNILHSITEGSTMVGGNASEFLLGASLGITIGGAILSFLLSLYFGQLSSQCHQTSPPPNHVNNQTSAGAVIDCGNHQGSFLAIWFWSGLVFWLNVGIAFLIAVGRSELVEQSSLQYESIDTTDRNGMAERDPLTTATGTRFFPQGYQNTATYFPQTMTKSIVNAFTTTSNSNNHNNAIPGTSNSSANMMNASNYTDIAANTTFAGDYPRVPQVHVSAPYTSSSKSSSSSSPTNNTSNNNPNSGNVEGGAFADPLTSTSYQAQVRSV